MQCIWIRASTLQDMTPDQPEITLTALDRSYPARLLPAPSVPAGFRDGIIHRNGNTVAVLTWESDNNMRIRRRMASPISGHWSLKDGDMFVPGDYQRVGMDIADPSSDAVADHLTGAFMHNEWGTGMFGFNYLADGAQQQLGLTWINRAELMVDRPGLV